MLRSTVDRTQEAYDKTAFFYGIEPALVTRIQIREARKEGAHDVPERQISRGIKSRIRGKATLPLEAVPEGYAVDQITTGPGGQSIRAKPFNPDALGEALPSGHVEAGRSTLLGSDGSVISQWIKTKAAPEVLTWDRLVREFDGLIPAADPVAPPTEPLLDSLLAIYPIGDPHLGLRSHDGEEGLEKGSRLLMSAVTDLVQRGPRSRECMIVNLGDYFHSDDPSNRTRRSGHDLDVDGSWFEILKVGRDVFIHLIQVALLHHETVNVKCLIGNHDDLSSLFLTLLVDAHFRHEPRVIVDTSGTPFQWFEWGSNLLGFTHGQACKAERLAGKMANAQREAWGRTLHRYWYVGHVHHSRKIERDGVSIESFRTLAPRDAYTEAAGYFSGRDLTRIVLHREHGEVSRETVSAGMLA